MHRLEPCKTPQKTLDGVNGAILNNRMAPAASNWPPSTSSSTWAGSSLAQPGPSWASTGLGPPSWAQGPLPGPSTAGIPWPAASSPVPGQRSGASSPCWTGSPGSDISKRPRPFNIHQRLRELYLEECRNGRVASTLPFPLRNLKRGSKLLEKLVEKDNLNTLIVNLYPGNKGYSLSLRLQGKTPGGRSQAPQPVVETIHWPYSDDELLQCLDREELPRALVDILETTHSRLFYQGCVIAEVRDYRHTYPLTTYETHHILLRPTTQTIINDVNMIAAQHELSPEERLSLESQIVKDTAPPLCLDPNPAIGMLLNNIQAKKHRWSTAPLRRAARKFSQVTVNRKRKLDQFTAHDSLLLHDFLVKRRSRSAEGIVRKYPEDMPVPPEVPRDDTPPLPPPFTYPDALEYATSLELPDMESSDSSSVIIEEYVLETERTQGSTYYSRLTVKQQLPTMEYVGNLYVDKDYREGERNGSSCQFGLGSLDYAHRYFEQFKEIFTEEGRKSVKITHLKPGQREVVTHTPNSRDRQAHVPLQAVVHRPMLNMNTQQVDAMVANNMGISPASSIAKPSAVPSMSQLTHLLKSAAVPPNVNVQQMHQQAGMQSILSGALNAEAVLNGPSKYQQPSPPKPSRPVLSSNPQITALATSLRNSVEQFEMQLASQAQAPQQGQSQNPSAMPASAQNPTILSLLKAAPGNTPKLTPRKNHATASARLQNMSNNVNKALLVNNNQQLRVTLSSFPNQLVGQTSQVNPPTTSPGFTVVANQASQSQTYSLSGLGNAQTFTVVHGNQNFTVPSVQGQTFQLNQSGAGGQTFTITAPAVSAAGQYSGQTAQNVYVSIPQTQTGGKGKSFTIQPKASASKPHVQRRQSNSFQQSELTKLLSGDSRAVTERHIVQEKDGREETRTSNLGLSMPGLSALLAGTPSADNPIPGASNSSSSTLLERLSTPTASSFTSPPAVFPPQSPSSSIQTSYTGSPNHGFNSVNSPASSLTSPGLPFTSPSPKSQQVHLQGASPTSPLSSPPGGAPVSLNLQGLSLQGLTSGLQLQIPGGIAVPISLSLNVSGGHQGVLMTSLPVSGSTDTTTTSDTGGSAQLSVPVAQIMSSGSKSRSQASISIPQGSGQSIQLVSALQRSNRHGVTAKNLQQRSREQRALGKATASASGAQISGSPVVAISPQQVDKPYLTSFSYFKSKLDSKALT